VLDLELRDGVSRVDLQVVVEVCVGAAVVVLVMVGILFRLSIVASKIRFVLNQAAGAPRLCVRNVSHIPVGFSFQSQESSFVH
jgi:hypothetical protein